MNFENFIDKLVTEVFESTQIEELTKETTLNEIEEWDSLIALSMISFFDNEFQIQISSDKLEGETSIGDLFSLVEKNVNF